MRRALLPSILLILLAACESRPPEPTPVASAGTGGQVMVSPDIALFYRERGSRPLWVGGDALRPEAKHLVEMLRRAPDHGLDPEPYGIAELEAGLAAARSGDKSALARAELLLSRAYAAFAADVSAPAPGAPKVHYVDAELAPQPSDARTILEAAAAAPSLSAHLAAVERVNPLYDALRRGYGRWRTSQHSAAEVQRVRLNLERARSIPAREGRYLIVDAASARLWMVEGGKVSEPMRVIAGKPHMQTPGMAGLIRHSVLNPYWNLPPDLARERAKRVLREGPASLRRERIEILSDWGDRPHIIGPGQVDWAGVAAGRKTLRLRQLPGGANVMGAMKFMLPNELGIYLHDFPDKNLFRLAERHLSSGCVRVADAARLASWLYGGSVPRPNGSAPEQRVDLPEPVPVYITYLTVLPGGPQGLTLERDPYRRDASAAQKFAEASGGRALAARRSAL
jgi:murein L,D-transpeptidase YcbB/YkuD